MQHHQHLLVIKSLTSPALVSNQELIDLVLLYKASSGYTMGSVVITDGTRTMTLETNGSIPVTLQDQHTPVVIAPFTRLVNSTTITSPMAIDDYTMVVADATGIGVGTFLTLFDPIGVRFMISRCVSLSTLTVTLDTPCDFAYPSGSYLDVGESNMNVDGSTTPVVFGLRNNAGMTPPPGLTLSFDVTRLMFTCLADSAVDLTLFGNIAKLTRGIAVRERNGQINNLFNVKSNEGIAALAYDFTTYAATNPQQGVDGFNSRLTFAGQSKMGVVIRLAIINEDLEVIIQDDLTDLTSFQIIAEGSIVAP